MQQKTHKEIHCEPFLATHPVQHQGLKPRHGSQYNMISLSEHYKILQPDLKNKILKDEQWNCVLWSLFQDCIYWRDIVFSLFIFFIFSLLCFRLWMNVGLRTNVKCDNHKKHCYWIANAKKKQKPAAHTTRPRFETTMDPNQKTKPKNQSMADRNQLLRPPTIQKQPHHVPCRNDCLPIRWWWCWCPWWWWWWPVTMTVVEICMPFALHNYRIRIWNAYLLPNLPFHVSINQTSYQLLFVVFRVPSSFVNASSLVPNILMYITTICIYLIPALPLCVSSRLPHSSWPYPTKMPTCLFVLRYTYRPKFHLSHPFCELKLLSNYYYCYWQSIQSITWETSSERTRI